MLWHLQDTLVRASIQQENAFFDAIIFYRLDDERFVAASEGLAGVPVPVRGGCVEGGLESAVGHPCIPVACFTWAAPLPQEVLAVRAMAVTGGLGVFLVLLQPQNEYNSCVIDSNMCDTRLYV